MNFLISSKEKTNNGFSLVEVLVAVSIFVVISISAYGGFIKIMEATKVLKIKNLSVNLANELIEITKNLPYQDVGIIEGIPLGKIPRDQIFVKEGITFNVNTSVRDIDDPFDGKIGEEPNDLSPADYRLVEFVISCQGCAYENELKYYTRVSPLNLETQGNNGALFVRVFDSDGIPIQGADVHIENNLLEQSINIDETTNNFGMFQVVDAPTSTASYEITVSNDDDYSVDKTYPINDPNNPIPDRPHANVSSGLVTQLSFYIDKLSQLEIYSKRNSCSTISSVDFNLTGSKTIGYQVYKYDVNHVTNSSGYKNIEDIEWDSYNFNITDPSWDLAGTSPLLPININPDTTQNIDLILSPKDPNSLHLSVVDSDNSLPISDAEVTISSGSDDASLITGRGVMVQTDWSGGSGYEYFHNNEKGFFFSDGNIDFDENPGDLKLSEIGGSYSASGFLESSIFDSGTTTNFGNLFWNPLSQNIQVGTEGIKIQIATNDIITATTTWNFIGPDGNSSTYYINPGQEIYYGHNGDRYLKYKIYLSTENTDFSPTVSNLYFTVMTDCTPPGQVLFNDLNLGVYSIEVIHPNYQNYFLDYYTIDSDWQTKRIELIPE